MKLYSSSSASSLTAFRSTLAILGVFCILGGLGTLPSTQRVAFGQEVIVDMNALSLREQELLRKERELLQAMGIAVKIEATNSGIAGSSEIADGSKQQEGLLDTIKSHPALKPRPPTSIDNATRDNVGNHIHPGQVRTHYSKDYYDGTTANRINRYFKLESDSRDKDVYRQRGRISPLFDEPELEQRAHVKDSETLVATIRSQRAVLKMGPNKKNTRILTLSKQSPVQIDYRKGSWYRVRTSAGVRGWIEGRDLLFNDGINPNSFLHIGGISSNALN